MPESIWWKAPTIEQVVSRTQRHHHRMPVEVVSIVTHDDVATVPKAPPMEQREQLRFATMAPDCFIDAEARRQALWGLLASGVETEINEWTSLGQEQTAESAGVDE